MTRLSVTVVSMSLVLASVLPSSAQDTAARADKIGSVRFPTSCSAAAQGQFEQAVALLHSFWYEEALKAFTAVTATDPACAMGYWGIAMSVYYPLWQPPSPADARERLGGDREDAGAGARRRASRTTSARSRSTTRTPTSSSTASARVAYEKAMEQVYVRYPDDREAAVFYALALNATAAPTDKTYANQLKAGAILEKVFAEQPNHPGVAHYIIHSYDYPPLASRGLAAARRYAKIAPSAPHALHMPVAHLHAAGAVAGVDRVQPRLGRRGQGLLRAPRQGHGVGPDAARAGLRRLRTPAAGAGPAGAPRPRRSARHAEGRARQLRRRLRLRGDPGPPRAGAASLERGGRAHCAPPGSRGTASRGARPSPRSPGPSAPPAPAMPPRRAPRCEARRVSRRAARRQADVLGRAGRRSSNGPPARGRRGPRARATRR